MGFRKTERRSGFTLIELLVVIAIISLIMALLLPAIMKALCNARAGAAAALISQMSQATKMYESDYAVYPPGRGDGTKDLQYYLTQKGPKRLSYFDFQPDMLDANLDIINPVYGPDGAPPTNKIYYRNNVAAIPSGGGMPPAQLGAMPVYKRNSFDIWCAGCDYTPGAVNSQWSVRYE